MYELHLKNVKTNQEFYKRIYSPYLFYKYLKKIRYSKQVRLISYMCY